MNKRLYASSRPGALGCLMDLYEQEVSVFIEMLEAKVNDENWSKILDPDTKDEQCKSVQSICEHTIRAANFYIGLTNKAEDPNYEIPQTKEEFPTKESFKKRMQETMQRQDSYFENRWGMPYEEYGEIKIKTSWGSIHPEVLLEHAVLHIMRHHRQILNLLNR